MYIEVGEAQGRFASSRAQRTGAAAFTILALAGCVAVGFSPKTAQSSSSLAIAKASTQAVGRSHYHVNVMHKADRDLDLLAVHMLQNGATMPETKMAKLLQDWRNSPNSIMGTLRETAQATLLAKSGHAMPSNPITMLAPVQDAQLIKMLDVQMLPGGDASLCGKRQLIIDKFDALLKKLGGEELSIKIQLGEVTEEWKDAMEGWLNAESQFRLRTEQSKEAEDGAKFAEEEYEKWRTAHKAARNDYKAAEVAHAEEMDGLKNEDAMIRKIMRYIGVLHDVKASEKSIAAGGRDSVKDESGTSNPYESDAPPAAAMAQTTAELEDKINQLSALMSKSDIAGAPAKVALLAQKASLGKLAVYDESVAVVKILKELLDDIVTRREVITRQEDGAKKLVEDAMNKMVEWETKLVALGNARDKAHAKAAAGADEKEKLNGEKVIAESRKDEIGEAAKVEIPPFDREIFVITMIKKKVNEFCNYTPPPPPAAEAAPPAVAEVPPPDSSGGGRRNRQDRH